MLKEVFRKRDLLGVLLAVLGAGMVVLSSNSEETAVSFINSGYNIKRVSMCNCVYVCVLFFFSNDRC